MFVKFVIHRESMKPKKVSVFHSYVIIAVLLGAGVLSYVFYLRVFIAPERGAEVQIPQDSNMSAAREMTADVQFDFGNGYKRRFSGAIYRGVSVAEVINAAAKSGDIRMYWEGDGLYFSDASDGKKRATVYKDDRRLEGDIQTIPLLGGAEIELRGE